MSNDKKADLMASMLGGESTGDAEDQDLFGDIPIDDPPAPAPAPAPAPFAAQNLNGSVYHDPMSNSGMQQQPQPQGQEQQNQQIMPHQPPPNNGMPNTEEGGQNFPFPQPQQQPLANAPNITYADLNSTNSNNPPMAQSQPAISSSPAPAPPASNTNMSKSLLLNSGLLGMASGGEGVSSDEKKADLGGGGLFDDIDQEEEQKQQAAAAKAAEDAEKKRQEEEQAAAAAAEAQQKQQEEQQRLQQQQQIQQPPAYTLDQRMAGMHLNPGQNSYLQQSQQQQQMMQQPHQPMMNSQQGQPGQLQNPQQMNQSGQMPNQQQQSQIDQPGQQQQMSQNNLQQPSMNQSNMQQPQQQPQQQPPPPSHVNVPGVMYREHPSGLGDNGINNSQSMMSQQQPGQGMMAPPQHPQMSGMMNQSSNNATSPNRYYQPSTPGSVTAGMHNASPNSPYGMQQQQQRMPAQPVPITKPPEVPTYYGKVTVNDPMLLQAPSKLLGMVSSPPHWSYQVTTQIKGQPPSVWMVRRRFRHVVALEDRLRMECPGAILAPRPDKHVSRAIEEASTHQSAEFAWQRAGELEQYLNALVGHPEVFGSQSLRMFLGLQDDMGTAWPECSSNAFTRMSAMGSTAAAGATMGGIGGFFGSTAAPANTTPGQSGVINNVIGSVANNIGVGELAESVTEDSAELLALSSSESIRMGAILQAVPKLEGAVTLLREQGEGAGAVGMELNRLAKEVLQQGDRELAQPLEIFSNGLLRYGRRTKRLGQEIGQATMTSFQMQYKLCRYEKMAWADRRNALAKRTKERGKADKYAQQMMVHQQQYGQQGGYGGGYGQQGGYGGQQPNMMMNNQYNGGNQMGQMMSNATMSDNMAVNAVHECDAVGERLKREINRVSFSRRMDWSKSIKVIASYMKEAAAERVAIWESTRDTFLQTFPEYHNDTSQWTNVTPIRDFAPQQGQMGGQPQPQQPPMNLNPGMSMNSSYMAQGPGAPMGMGQSYMQASPQQQQQPGQFSQNSMMASSGMVQQPQQPH